jgi:N-acetylneuraminate synthase
MKNVFFKNTIKEDNSVFLIAEIGINHNGSVNTAKKLIYEAKMAGFDSVKFQKRDIDLVYSFAELNNYRISPFGTTNREQKKGLEFNYEQYSAIDEYCKELEIEWFASAWDLDSVDFLRKFNLKYNKIASPMLSIEAFLHKIAEEKKYTFISTGMSTDKEIRSAVEIFNSHKCPFELMHCVSTYPSDDNEINLNGIISLRNEYNCNVGYSGHERAVLVSIAAVTLGATSVERHITLDRTMYGSDQSASLEPQGFKSLVDGIKKIELAMGDGKTGFILDSEKPARDKLSNPNWLNN